MAIEDSARQSTTEDRSKTSDDGEVVRVTFHPQVWKDIWEDEYPVAEADTEEFYVPAEDATDDSGNLLPDQSDESAALRRHPDAPARARNWEGPFYVTLEQVSGSGGGE